MRNYQINRNTLAIMPFGNKKSVVYEDRDYFIIDRRPNSIIDYNCKFHGSTLEGRLRGTEILTGYSYKAPVTIRDDKNEVFFPTCSPRLKTVSWVSLSNIRNYYFDNVKKLSVINFINEKNIEFNTSFGIINNQILRATRLEAILRQNKG